jgi:hypothetical protein
MALRLGRNFNPTLIGELFGTASHRTEANEVFWFDSSRAKVRLLCCSVRAEAR